jgi:transposase InsO family protein
VRKRGGRKRALGTRSPMALPEAASQRWSLDFVSDALASGRRFRVLAVVDDFTRECLGFVADTSMSGLRVGRELDGIIEQRGCRPATMVSDNGMQLTSHAILRWQEERSVLWHYIAPGKPQQNGFVEASRVGSGMNASTSTCSAAWPRHAGSLKHGGSLQHRTPTHEPERAHPSSLCNPPQPGAHRERTLLMNEGALGAGSKSANKEKRRRRSVPEGKLVIAAELSSPNSRALSQVEEGFVYGIPGFIY